MEEPLREFEKVLCVFRNEEGEGFSCEIITKMPLWSFLTLKSEFYLFRTRPEIHLRKLEAFLYFHMVTKNMKLFGTYPFYLIFIKSILN